MPRQSKYPRLRAHVRKGKGGQVWSSWWYDMRTEGKPDVSLGTDYEQALKLWDELHNKKPRIVGTIQEAFDAWELEVLPGKVPETRRGYAQNLKMLRKVFNPATWDTVTFPVLKQYLKKRTAKTQANREMAVLGLIWNWARGEGYTALPWPAAGMEKSRWKNLESARTIEVSDALFAAIYSEACDSLKDCMDLASATGLRLTDCRLVPPPPGNTLRVRANKTGKWAEFSATDSPVLTRLLSKRKESGSLHLRLLLNSQGKPLTARGLRSLWDDARTKAAAKPENKAIKDQIEALFLRDMRKRAADLAENLSEASQLLQHSSEAVTAAHYRTKPTKVRPVR